VALTPEDISELSAVQRALAFSQLSQTQVLGLSAAQAQAFGLIGNGTQVQQPPPSTPPHPSQPQQPQQQGEPSQSTDGGDVTFGSVIPVATPAKVAAPAPAPAPAPALAAGNGSQVANDSTIPLDLGSIVGTEGQSNPVPNNPQQNSSNSDSQSPQPNLQGLGTGLPLPGSQQNQSQPDIQQTPTKTQLPASQKPLQKNNAQTPKVTGSIALEAAEEEVIEAEQAVATANASTFDAAVEKLALAEAKEKAVEGGA
jgi:hypothetical protein